MNLIGIFRYRRTDSPQRKGLRVAVYEGVPAAVFSQLISGPFLTAYLLYLGASTQQIGIVLAIPALANLLQVFGAVLLQRFENRKLVYIVVGSMHRGFGVLTGAVPFVFPQELWVAVYIGAFTMTSISASLLGVVWSSLISDMVPDKVRGQYFGFRNIALGAVGSLCLFVTGVIIERLPGEPGFTVMYLIGTVAVVVNIALFFLYPNPPFEKSQTHSASRLLLKPFQDNFFFRALLLLAVWTLVVSVAQPFYSYVMLEVLGIGYQWVSTMTVMQTLASMLGFFVWSRLSVRYSTRTLLMWTLPIIAFSCLLWSAISVLPVVLVLAAVHLLTGFGSGGYGQMAFIFIIGDTPKAERPTYIAVFYAVTGLAGFVGPMAGGYIFDLFAEAPLWVQSYGVFAGAGVLLMALALLAGPAVFRDGERKGPSPKTKRLGRSL
ncbi:MAG TPA: MFS transporter [Paenibacillus sp.]|nr:MFS transporter [Paenibacillus sp.]